MRPVIIVRFVSILCRQILPMTVVLLPVSIEANVSTWGSATPATVYIPGLDTIVKSVNNCTVWICMYVCMYIYRFGEM